MANFVKAYKVDPGVRLLAQQLTRNLKSYDTQGEIAALQQFVRDQIRYVQDVDGVETLQTPAYTLQVGSGDCDDKATLLGALLASIGFPVQLIAVGFDGVNFSHVLAAAKLGTRWIPLETIVPTVGPGWFPNNANPILPWTV